MFYQSYSPNIAASVIEKKSYRWRIVFEYEDKIIKPIELFATKVKKPSFKVETVTKKLNYTYNVNFPKTVSWNPIDITFVDFRYNKEADLDNSKTSDSSDKLTESDYSYDLTTLDVSSYGKSEIFKEALKLNKDYRKDEDPKSPEMFRRAIEESFLRAKTIGKKATTDKIVMISPQQAFTEYLLSMYSLTTETIGNKKQYEALVSKNSKLKGLKIYELNPNGQPMESWTIINPIITSVDYGTLDYSTDTLMTVSVGMIYDFAELKTYNFVEKQPEPIIGNLNLRLDSSGLPPLVIPPDPTSFNLKQPLLGDISLKPSDKLLNTELENISLTLAKDAETRSEIRQGWVEAATATIVSFAPERPKDPNSPGVNLTSFDDSGNLIIPPDINDAINDLVEEGISATSAPDVYKTPAQLKFEKVLKDYASKNSTPEAPPLTENQLLLEFTPPSEAVEAYISGNSGLVEEDKQKLRFLASRYKYSGMSDTDAVKALESLTEASRREYVSGKVDTNGMRTLDAALELYEKFGRPPEDELAIIREVATKMRADRQLKLARQGLPGNDTPFVPYLEPAMTPEKAEASLREKTLDLLSNTRGTISGDLIKLAAASSRIDSTTNQLVIPEEYVEALRVKFNQEGKQIDRDTTLRYINTAFKDIDLYADAEGLSSEMTKRIKSPATRRIEDIVGRIDFEGVTEQEREKSPGSSSVNGETPADAINDGSGGGIPLSTGQPKRVVESISLKSLKKTETFTVPQGLEAGTLVVAVGGVYGNNPRTGKPYKYQATGDFIADSLPDEVEQNAAVLGINWDTAKGNLGTTLVSAVSELRARGVTIKDIDLSLYSKSGEFLPSSIKALQDLGLTIKGVNIIDPSIVGEVDKQGSLLKDLTKSGVDVKMFTANPDDWGGEDKPAIKFQRQLESFLRQGQYYRKEYVKHGDAPKVFFEDKASSIYSTPTFSKTFGARR